ncbi:MAG: hypothetical protein UY67_C0001G0052 [Candidatus Kaiserbacteria bacterium GW2011_GWA2_52_12]|uniref:Uncharacterized protein n=1 Tax=Candidatus Kaiserbacteria bacterium GW2011_GWA2_52_12 TaxID=1618671 RepID=A0A0G1X2D3_9BACT|nr:MAG: hypothetical protein UY67_C0001G0052 [Candidatus Kaiserbacteria bacterium GW2011_GWA2_52_12]
MHTQRVLYVQFFSVAVLAALTWVALAQDLFFRLWWFDIPMHLLGGVWAGYAVIWVLQRKGWGVSLVHAVVGAFAIGVAWELFEYFWDMPRSPFMSYPLDTAKDLLMDILGGVVAYLSTRRRS